MLTHLNDRHDIKFVLQFLGPKLAEKHQVVFSEEKLNAGKGMFNTFQYGYYKGATQVGKKSSKSLLDN